MKGRGGRQGGCHGFRGMGAPAVLNVVEEKDGSTVHYVFAPHNTISPVTYAPIYLMN